MRHVVIGNQMMPFSLTEDVFFDEQYFYYLCVKSFQQDENVVSHYADSIELVFCDGLTGFFEIDGKRYELREKTVLYIPPMVVHRSEVRAGNGKMYVLKISHDFLRTYLDLETILNSFADASIMCDPFMSDDFPFVFTEIAELIRHDGDDMFALGRILNIFYHLSPQMKMGKQTETSDPASRISKGRMIGKIIRWTKTHFMEGLTNQLAAEYLGYDKNYFSHWFHRMMGVTYSDYLMRLKIQYVCKEIQKDVPIMNIIDALGYSNASYFIRKFREYTGYTPSEYRKMLQKKQENE